MTTQYLTSGPLRYKFLFDNFLPAFLQAFYYYITSLIFFKAEDYGHRHDFKLFLGVSEVSLQKFFASDTFVLFLVTAVHQWSWSGKLHYRNTLY